MDSDSDSQSSHSSGSSTSSSSSSTSSSNTPTPPVAGPDYYCVEKLLDIRNVEQDHGEAVEYRVRWKGYRPVDDSYEPASNFNSGCSFFFDDFWNRYEAAKQEYAKKMRMDASSVSEPNILSQEIDAIMKVSHKKVRSADGDSNKVQKQTFYLVKWHGFPEEEDWSWVDDKDLKHASDKVEAFEHQCRIQQVLRDGTHHDKPSTLYEDRKRRVKDREFFEGVKRGHLPPEEITEDLYSKVKSRRGGNQGARIASPSHSSTSTHEASFTDEEPDTPRRRKKRNRKEAHHVSDSNQSTSTSAQDENQPPIIGLLSDLPRYNPQEACKVFQEMELETSTLTLKQFRQAALNNDYYAVFTCMKSETRAGDGKLSGVDFPQLFLSAARRGWRDMALLLAARVPNLAVRDEWGENALTMAAKMGDVCFCHKLLELGISIDETNMHGQTAEDLASQFRHRHTLAFLQKYKQAATASQPLI